MEANPDPRTSAPRWVGWLLALALAVVWLPPSLEQLTQRFIGVEYVDHYGTQWFYWYAGQILQGLQSASSTDLFFYPWGKDVYGHTGSNMVDAWLAQPFLALLGPVAGYNAFIVLIVATNVWAAAHLARRWTGDPLVRMVVGLVFAFQPYLLNEITEGRPTQALMAFVLLFFDRLLGLPEQRGWRNPVLAGFWLALSGYTYWFYAIFSGFAALAVGLLAAATHREQWARVLGRFVLAGVVALAFVLPVAMPMLTAAASGNVPGLLDVSAWNELVLPLTQEGQLVGVYAWQPFAAGHGFWIVTLSGEEHFIPRLAPLPLVLLVGLATLLLRPGKLPRAALLTTVAVATAFAVGPVIVAGGVAVDNPVYGLLLEILPPLRRLWWPGRAFALIGMVAPLGLIPLLEAVKSVVGRSVLGAVLVGALAAALVPRGLLPASAWDATVPAGYQCLASGPPAALIELPYAFTQGHLYYQTTHHRPILGGMLEDNAVFAPAEQTALRTNNSFLKALIEAPPGEEIDTSQATEADRQALRDLGYGYVVLQVDAFRARVALSGMAEAIMGVRLRAIRRSFDRALGSPVYEDARVVIWSPWGLEVPCDLSTFVKDKGSPGRTDVISKQRDIGSGRTLAHIGRPADAGLRIARLIVERNGPDKAAAERIIAELTGQGTTGAGLPGTPPAPGTPGLPGTPPAPGTPGLPGTPEGRGPAAPGGE